MENRFKEVDCMFTPTERKLRLVRQVMTISEREAKAILRFMDRKKPTSDAKASEKPEAPKP